MTHPFTLKQLPGSFGICKLPLDNALPDWLPSKGMVFIARTPDELSIMCAEQDIPTDVDASRGWCCLRVDGDLAFDEVGVVAKIAAPLADVNLSIFVVSTHDRDYVLVHQMDLEAAFSAYQQAGFRTLTP